MAGRGKLPPVSVDREWFEQRWKDKGLVQADLARAIDILPPGMTHRLNGKTRFRIEEIETIARVLDAPVDEVMRRAGFEINSRSGLDLDLQAIIDEAGRVVPAAAPMVVSPETMNLLKANIPINRRDAYEVAQVRADKGEMSLLDDNLVLYETPVSMNPGPASVLSVSKLRDGSVLLGKVTEWRKTGEAKIRTPDGQTRQVEMAASSPVKLIVP